MDAYRVLGLLLVSGFYGAYFVKQIALRRRGIAVNRLAKGGKRGRAFAVELALLLATFGMAAVQYGSLITGWQWRVPGAVRVLGLLLMALGVAVFVLAILTMRGMWRAGIPVGEKPTLVAHGVYSQSRNPAFLGFDLLYVGTALVCPNVATVLGALLCVWLMHQQIRMEEAFLTDALGEPYRAYCVRTPRYLLFR